MHIKQLFALLLALAMVFLAAACGTSQPAAETQNDATEPNESTEPDLLSELEARDCTSVSEDGLLLWSPYEMTQKYNETLSKLDGGLSVQLQSFDFATTVGGGLYAGDDVIGVFTFPISASADKTGMTPNVAEYFDVAVLEGDAEQMQTAMAAMMMTLDDSLTFEDATALLELLTSEETIVLHGVTYDASLSMDPNTIDTIRFQF